MLAVQMVISLSFRSENRTQSSSKNYMLQKKVNLLTEVVVKDVILWQRIPKTGLFE